MSEEQVEGFRTNARIGLYLAKHYGRHFSAKVDNTLPDDLQRERFLSIVIGGATHDEPEELETEISDLGGPTHQLCLTAAIVDLLSDIRKDVRYISQKKSTEIAMGLWFLRREGKHGPVPRRIRLWVLVHQDYPRQWIPPRRVYSELRKEYDKWMRRKPRKAAK